jgi:uncharacterized protein (TIGR02588 family)
MADSRRGAASGGEDSRDEDGGTHGAQSRWEWIAAVASSLLVLAVVGYLLYDAVARPDTPPAMEVRADTVLRAGGVWLVEFSVHNRGHRTAADVHVQGELREGERTVESGEAAVDYVPGESVRRGGLYFRADPRAYRLELRASGYQEP